MSDLLTHSCDNCGRLLPKAKNTIYWVMNQCNHCLCPVCFSTFLLKHQFTTTKMCPCCNQITPSAKQVVYSNETNENNEIDSISIKTDLINLNPDPESEKIIVIRLDHEKEEETIQMLPSQEKFEEGIKVLFRKLNKVLIIDNKNNKEKEKKNIKGEGHSIDVIQGQSYSDKLKSLIQSDSSLLSLCLEQLIKGDRDDTCDSVGIRQCDRIKVQAYVAADIIRHSLSNKGSEFRRLMTNAMNNLGDDKSKYLLQRIGICYSRQNEAKHVKKRLRLLKADRLKEINLSKYCFAITLFDNLGFVKRMGKMGGAGYVQYTIVHTVIIPPSDLLRINVYNQNQDLRLSRQRLEWKDVREQDPDERYDEIMKPNRSDCENLTGVTLHIIKSIIQAEADGIFPSLNQCKKLLESEAYTSKKHIAPIWKSNCFYFHSAFGVTQEEENNDDDTIHGSSAFEKVVHDVPMSKDLSKNDTVLELMKYSANVKEYIVTEGHSSEQDATIGTPVFPDLRIGFGGDGKPISQAQALLRDEENDELAKSIHPSFGGFHLQLEIWKKTGGLFELTH